MKSSTILIILASMTLMFTSCDKAIQPSGRVTQELHNFSDYKSIDISDAFEVIVEFSSNDEGVTVEADDNIHEYLDVKVIGDRLYLGIQRKYDIKGNATMKAYIATNDPIGMILASGASNIKFQNELIGQELYLEASGASNINGDIDVANLSLALSGASNMDIEGKADDVYADLSGASSFYGYDNVMQDLDIELSGASTARVKVESTLKVNASGASSVSYKGNPSINAINITGASQIIDAN